MRAPDIVRLAFSGIILSCFLLTGCERPGDEGSASEPTPPAPAEPGSAPKESAPEALKPNPVRMSLVARAAPGRLLRIGVAATHFPSGFRGGRGATVTVRLMDKNGNLLKQKSGTLQDFGFS
jgi:hypothetical protein